MANGTATAKGTESAVPLAAHTTLQPTSRTKQAFTQADIDTLTAICTQQTSKADYPHAEAIISNCVVYDAPSLLSSIRGGTETHDAAMAELHYCLLSGPGVFVVRGAFSRAVVDRASLILEGIVARERATSSRRTDHFAPAGANDRIWNSFQKHALSDPPSFVEYYANEILALASEAWLGPGYAITAQTNIVRPGGRAQEPHRDYHLGFQSSATAARYPLAAQVASQLLTLQGAVAHTDMPVESGPTQLLPFSQHFEAGYLAYREPEFRDVFNAHMVQLELHKGDALFFNPALFHAAGENRTQNLQRAANLVQVSACWSKPMESVDRSAVVKAVWEEMRAFAKGRKRPVRRSEVAALIAAVPDAYSFPTNLDTDPPPPEGHCPPTQKDRVAQAIMDDVDLEEMSRRVDEYDKMRRA